MLRELSKLRIQAHLHIEQAAMTGRDTLPATAASVVNTVKHVWCLVVVVVAFLRAFDIFRYHSSARCHRWRV